MIKYATTFNGKLKAVRCSHNNKYFDIFIEDLMEYGLRKKHFKNLSKEPYLNMSMFNETGLEMYTGEKVRRVRDTKTSMAVIKILEDISNRKKKMVILPIRDSIIKFMRDYKYFKLQDVDKAIQHGFTYQTNQTRNPNLVYRTQSEIMRIGKLQFVVGCEVIYEYKSLPKVTSGLMYFLRGMDIFLFESYNGKQGVTDVIRTYNLTTKPASTVLYSHVIPNLCIDVVKKPISVTKQPLKLRRGG